MNELRKCNMYINLILLSHKEERNFVVWCPLKKLKIELSYDPAIPFLGTYPKKCKSGYNKDTCTPIFVAALFTIAKLSKQRKCLTTDE
jgi:hypothetical protein